MRQMQNKILMVFAVLLMFACQIANAGNIVSISNVDVIPNQPLNTDLITFQISGLAADGGSWVDHDVFSQSGTSLQLDLYIVLGMAYGAPYPWNYSKQIQPLAPATYSLEIQTFDNFYSDILYDTYNTSFTVTPEPSTLVVFGVGLPLLRMFSGRKH